MYRRLDGAHIVETLDLVQRRIEERFPGSGLSQVSGELLAVARDAIGRAVDLSRPNLTLRIASGLVIALMVALGVGALLNLKLSADLRTLTDLMQSQAIQNFVFLGVAVVFLATVDTRLKRGRALKALHELRSIAHVVDMHQLGKAPNEFLPGREEIQVTPDGEISFEWEAGAHGWLQLLVRGDGQLTHSAVLEGDEYGQSEDFGDALPDWAASLVARLMRLGH